MQRFAAVILVDTRGRLLLQERDEHAPIDPECWGFVGGHVDDGEGFEPAAYRELEEETGIRAGPGGLELWREFEISHHTPGRGVMQVYVAGTDLGDEDVECHEGRRIVFVEPEAAAGLPLTGAATPVVPAFLASAAYQRCIAADHG